MITCKYKNTALKRVIYIRLYRGLNVLDHTLIKKNLNLQCVISRKVIHFAS